MPEIIIDERLSTPEEDVIADIGIPNPWWVNMTDLVGQLSPKYPTDNHFTDYRTIKKGINCYRLFRISYVPIRYHVKVKSNANPYMPEFDKYFFQRKKWRFDLAKQCKQFTTFVVKETNNNSRVSLRRESLKSA